MERKGMMNGGRGSLVKAAVVAEALGISQAFVYRSAKRGVLPHVRLGRAVRFDLDAVLATVSEGGGMTDGETVSESVEA